MTQRRDQHRVRFEPDHIEVRVGSGANLLEAAIAAGVHVNASCGGTGTCGTCNVLIKEGRVESSRTEKVSTADYERGVRQACRSAVVSDLVVEVPPESRLERAVLARETPKNVTGSGRVVARDWPFEPVINKTYVELTPPSIKDNSSDLDRLMKGLQEARCPQNIEVSLRVVRKLSEVIREADWQVTATLLKNQGHTKLINLEAGDTRAVNLALAFDIGTTAVRGQLLDLGRGRVLASSIDYNGQISYGADVISRIVRCQKPGGLAKMQHAVVGTMNKLIEEMTGQANADVQRVNHMMVAANTVMVHFLLQLDPRYLRLSPYVPATSEVPMVRGRDLGLDVAEHVHVSFLPSVASYVGGDIVSGIVGTGIYQQEDVTLYMDIGTNGEIVAGNRDWMVTAAASAGPTFEGGGIRHGMLATSGAIEGFEMDPATFEPKISTIGGEKPRGICGSGLINIAAAMLKANFISQNGKFNPDKFTRRLRMGEAVYEYVLAWEGESQTGHDIVITEIDLDNLIRAKAAMYAGCQTLLKGIGNGFESVDRVVIAGTFGSRLHIENAITIGLLPDLPREKFIFVGNGSLLGARLCSFSTPLLNDASRVAELMTNIELSDNADFMTNYVAAMFLPHTNMSELFPSVKLEAQR